MGKNKPGLLIVVKNGYWDAYAETSTWRKRMLYKLLEAHGGISDSVPDGEYLYAIQRQGLHLIESLIPAE